jgi:hypothetical protein
MPLNLERLDAVKRLHDGVIIARCPACAAAGHDHQGNHLKVYRCGKFCCVVFPGKEGREHRRQIFRLVGKHGNRRPPLKMVYTVKVASA